MELLSRALIETSTLIAASIRAILSHDNIQHKNYDVSKSLFNFFQSNLKLAVGITTDTVIEQSWRTLEKAIGDTVDEYTKNEVASLNLASKIKDTIEDNL